MRGFMFATGIENSYPTIAGGVRIDQMEKCGHYAHWREDLHLVRDLGIHFLRWGPALHRTFLGPEHYDWAWTDDVLDEMQGLDIQPILDLCHFGVPDWLGNFQNPDFADYFAEYASACAAGIPASATGRRSMKSSSRRFSQPSTAGGTRCRPRTKRT